MSSNLTDNFQERLPNIRCLRYLRAELSLNIGFNHHSIVMALRDVEKNNLPIFRPPSIITIEKNPQHSPAMPAVFTNRDDQIRPKAERDIR